MHQLLYNFKNHPAWGRAFQRNPLWSFAERCSLSRDYVGYFVYQFEYRDKEVRVRRASLNCSIKTQYAEHIYSEKSNQTPKASRFRMVPHTSELSNQIYEGLLEIYKLKPFIDADDAKLGNDAPVPP